MEIRAFRRFHPRDKGILRVWEREERGSDRSEERATNCGKASRQMEINRFRLRILHACEREETARSRVSILRGLFAKHYTLV